MFLVLRHSFLGKVLHSNLNNISFVETLYRHLFICLLDFDNDLSGQFFICSVCNAFIVILRILSFFVTKYCKKSSQISKVKIKFNIFQIST